MVGLWVPGCATGSHCGLSSSVLKIDLLSMAFLELQWLVRPSTDPRLYPSAQLRHPVD